MAERVASKKELTNEIATIGRDITAPLASFVLRPRDEVLLQQGGGKGLALYDSIRRDPHAGAVLRKRRTAVVAREWEVVAAGESPREQAAAELVRGALQLLPFDRFCLGLLNCQLYGYAVAELIWGAATIEGVPRLVPVKAKVRNPRRFVFAVETGRGEEQLRLLTLEAPVEGEALPDRKFVVARFGEEETEDPYGLGLGNPLFWPVYFKRQGIAFWMTFVERFAAPTTVGEYPPGTPEEEQHKLLSALQALSNETGVIVPSGTVLKLLEAQRSGSIDSYEKLCRYMDEQISEVVLGETLSTNIGRSGSYAASQTHQEVREELTDADADLLSDVLNDSLVRWIVEVNLPGAGLPKVWRVKPDEEDLAKRAERDERLVGMGFRPSLEYVTETYGGEWSEAPAPQASPARAEGVPPAPRPGPSFAEPEPDRVDELRDQLDGLARGPVEAMTEALRREVEAAQDWPDLERRLLAFAAAHPVADLAALIGDATAVAELAGRADLAEERPAAREPAGS